MLKTHMCLKTVDVIQSVLLCIPYCIITVFVYNLPPYSITLSCHKSPTKLRVKPK